MRKTPLPSAEALRCMLDYDPQTGKLRWKARSDRSPQWNARYAGTIAGKLNSFGHRIVCILGPDGKKRMFRASRLAWVHFHAREPENEIDHKDLDAGNDRIDNLREATGSQNSQNQRARSKRGFPKGVSLNRTKKKYIAQCGPAGSDRYLGSFDTLEEAHKAYAAKAKELYGEFARLA